APAGAATDGSGALRARGDRLAEPDWPRLDRLDRPRPGLYLRGASTRVDSVQSSVRGSALRVSVLTGGYDVARCLRHARRLAVAYLPEHCPAALARGDRDRRGFELRAHARRVRRRAHGWRKSAWYHANRFHLYLRPGAGISVRGGPQDGASAPGVLLRR